MTVATTFVAASKRNLTMSRMAPSPTSRRHSDLISDIHRLLDTRSSKSLIDISTVIVLERSFEGELVRNLML